MFLTTNNLLQNFRYKKLIVILQHVFEIKHIFDICRFFFFFVTKRIDNLMIIKEMQFTEFLQIKNK